MSSSSSTSLLLELVEHLRQGVFDPQPLFDFVRADIRILTVLYEAWTLVIANELDERFRVCFPIRGKPFEIFEDRIDSSLREECDRVLSVFIEVRVEDSLIHEPRVIFEQHPAKVMELERSEHVRITLQRFRQLVAIVANCLSSTGLDLSDDRESITCGRLGENRTIFSFFQ